MYSVLVKEKPTISGSTYCGFDLQRVYKTIKSLTGLSILFLAGCVTPISMEEESPDLSYVDPDTILISIVDNRNQDADVIGRAHGVFGIPSKMPVYPWFETEREKKHLTLAQALEDRLIFGLNDEGWNVISAGFDQHPAEQEVLDSLLAANARNLLLVILNDWYVSINLNWVSAFNFDWGTTVKILIYGI